MALPLAALGIGDTMRAIEKWELGDYADETNISNLVRSRADSMHNHSASADIRWELDGFGTGPVQRAIRRS